MSPIRVHRRISTTPPVIATDNRRRSFFKIGARLGLALFAVLLAVRDARAGTNVDLGTDVNGITLTAVGNNYTATFGGLLNNMDALGISVPATNVSVIPLTNGALYYTYYDVIIKSMTGSHTAYVTAAVSQNFVHPQAFVVWSCPYPSTCNASGNYSPIAGTVNVIPSPGLAQGNTQRVGLGIYLPDNDGSNAYMGIDAVTITFTAIDFNNGKTVETILLTLTSANLEKAVQFQLGTYSPSGRTVASGSDYLLDFGTVNALGIGPGANLSTSSQAGGIVYSTPYNLLPAFSDQTNTSASITVCVSTPFHHPTILILEDSPTGSAGTFSSISGCSSPTSLTNTAADRSSITRFLGLFVSNANGPTAYTGFDNATLTYTLTVP